MASQKDVQDLLRLLTTGRNKMPMMAAMGRAKSLQAAGLRSISEVASAELTTLETATKDPKAAKALQTACKALLKNPDKKRPAESSLTSPPKHIRSAYELPAEAQTPQALEASLALPQPSEDEECISKTTIYTNRAPLVLAFALQLLKYTMPEQPLSSRLSLAQAVVSVNSRSKAVSLGLEKGIGAEDGWGTGQPKVRILGRDIYVLKRSTYDWKDKREGEDNSDDRTEAPLTPRDGLVDGTAVNVENGVKSGNLTQQTVALNDWSTSVSVTSKGSTFVARAITITSPAQARTALQGLFLNNKDLSEASHNITAWRVMDGHGIKEDSDDDGETGGGRHILGILQSGNVVGVLVVVTRWYGGVMLGPDRWRIMNQVSQDALSQRLRISGVIGQEALWGLDLEAMRSTDGPVIGGLPTYQPAAARQYILKAFGNPPQSVDTSAHKKKSRLVLEKEKEENLVRLLGALDILLRSWAKHISREELDRRAWGWYVHVRPEVDSGVAGWGGKGEVKLQDILNLRRRT